MQFQAGYCLDSVWSNLIDSGRDIERVKGLLKSISIFDVEGINEKQNKNIDPVVAVANNIITRGLPTKPSTFVEETILEETGFLNKIINDLGAISYKIEESMIFSRLLYRSIHLIDPKIKPENIKNSGSYLENRFLKNDSPNCFHPFLSQIWEPQKYLESIMDSDKTNDKFVEQRVDFAIKFPYLISSKHGLVVETDGKEYHETEEQKRLDLLRDRGVERSDWFETIRIKYDDNDETTKEKLKDLENILNEEYFKILKENYDHPLFLSKDGEKALKLVLKPIGIARIQKTIIELIIKGILKLNDKTWKIGIIERDISCGELALQDLKGIFYNLFELEGNKRKLPEVDLTIFKDANIPENKSFDVIIDISILQRKELLKQEIPLKMSTYITIRSVFSETTKRKFYTTELIKYPNFKKLIKEKQKSKVQALQFLLQWIFRKNEFKPGQIKIISAILQLKNPLALLPTGGGKSLTYQLSSFLQPGVTIVVDPIKSLMKDQYQSLIKMKIDNSIVINSSVKDTSEKMKLIEEMINGEVLFVFVSPERFLIKKFRDKLTEAFNQKKTYFSYCVIDEVHCVSEWGHDFRTAYLRLGENARKFCRRKNGKPVVLVGLTATASYDVLTDVQRELEIKDKNIIRLEYLKRPELQYHIIEVPESNNKNLSDSEKKIEAVPKLILQIPDKLKASNKIYQEANNKKKYALSNNIFSNNVVWGNIPGLVFCPYKKSWFDVENVAIEISKTIDTIKIGTFMGSSDNDRNEEQISSINQDKFLNNELDIMIATKAFGMGIDKSNIRYTIHLNYPSSIESFYQEAGRSGRDKRLALCCILYDKTLNKDKIIPLRFLNNSFRGIDKEKWVLLELISKIEKELENIQNGEKISMTIEFSNHTDEKIQKIINDPKNPDNYLKKIKKSYSWCQDPKIFIANLSKNTNINIKSKEIIDKIEKLFWQWRDKEETDKAIYRLSSIGIIDDYIVNYNENSYTVEIYKQTDQELYLKYLKYLKRYWSEKKSIDLANLVWQHKGNSMIQKCTGSLIEFVYKEIQDKRKKAIDSMETACILGLDKGSVYFEEYMELYFDSKYYEELADLTDKGKNDNIDFVWQYIKGDGIIDGNIDNMKHLRGATTRLLNENPNNSSLLLMNAFCYFVLEKKNKDIRNKASEDVLKAFEIILNENKMTPIEYFKNIELYKKYILESNSKQDLILNQTFNLLELKFHNNWLKNYNLQYIN